MTKATVAALQFGTGLDKRENVATALTMLDQLASSGQRLDLVCLPEFFTLRALHAVEGSEVWGYSEPEGGVVEEELATRAGRLGAYLVAGTFLRRGSGGRIYNEALVFDRLGNLVTRYQKTHLFDAPGHSESDVVSPGQRLVVFDADFGRVGVAICYELRFPEVARTLALAGATILAVPNSWPHDGLTRGGDQLRILLQGTALQNLLYIIHANQFGHVAGLDLCGQTSVVDPKGQVVAQASDMDQAVTATIELGFVDHMRRTRTTFSHRRPELYTLDALFIPSSPEAATGEE